MPHNTALLHLMAGGCGGTMGAILTCPLEVVKTRQQASRLTFRHLYFNELNLQTVSGGGGPPARTTTGVLHLLRSILQNEGPRSLFRGLGPNLVGVAPSRAIYFGFYSGAKQTCNSFLEPESKLVHILSASFAGFMSITLTNPIWMVKTRMQLDKSVRGERCISTVHCVRYIYRTEGLRGFYRGMSASYVGISETVIQFVIYEELKQRLKAREPDLYRPLWGKGGSAPHLDFTGLMLAAGFSKTCGSIIAYPHEVIRTRLRQEGSPYKSFLQTARLVYHEEGFRAFYRGLGAQMIRQIPNTAIVMGTYELIVNAAANA